MGYSSGVTVFFCTGGGFSILLTGLGHSLEGGYLPVCLEVGVQVPDKSMRFSSRQIFLHHKLYQSGCWCVVTGRGRSFR